jgi:hypothetical protein
VALAAKPQLQPLLTGSFSKSSKCVRRQGGSSMRNLLNKVAGQIELQDAIFNGDAVGEALQIEEVLNLAHEIHRARGGLFGYDLEDWQQAERELIGKNRPNQVQLEETAHAEQFPRDQERNCQKCFGLNN